MGERIALVRRPSSRMAEGIVTHVDRIPADADLAARQHEAYVAAIAGAGWAIREVYAGRGERTNGEGIRQLRRHAATRGRTVVPVPLHACCT